MCSSRFFNAPCLFKSISNTLQMHRHWRKLKLKKLDIALLQETHSGSDAVVQQWLAEMGADCH